MSNLQTTDTVGISFWLISMAMVAAAVFFFIERDRVASKWKTSLTVCGLIQLIAAVHYFYMRGVWVETGETPTVYRYIDWLLTVPLQMIEFYLILAAITVVAAGVFWRLLIGTLVMLIAGYMGEAGLADATICFVIGLAGWGYILYEVFSGEAGQINAASANESCQSAYNGMKLIVSIGWAIYPLGYFLGYLNGAVSADSLNLVYNLADLVNKIGFGMFIWAAAVADSSEA